MKIEICESRSIENTDRDVCRQIEIKNDQDQKNSKEYPQLRPKLTEDQEIAI